MFKSLMEWLLGKPAELSWDEIPDSDKTSGGDDLSKAEARCIDRGQCPDCGGKIMLGPEGCGSTNVKCDSCGHVFNMALGFACGERIENSIW